MEHTATGTTVHRQYLKLGVASVIKRSLGRADNLLYVLVFYHNP